MSLRQLSDIISQLTKYYFLFYGVLVVIILYNIMKILVEISCDKDLAMINDIWQREGLILLGIDEII